MKSQLSLAEDKRCAARSIQILRLCNPCHLLFEHSFISTSLAIWLCSASKLTRGATVGRPWAHCKANCSISSWKLPFNMYKHEKQVYLTWKQRDVCFSSSTIREHSDRSKGSPNIIAPSKTNIYKIKGGWTRCQMGVFVHFIHSIKEYFHVSSESGDCR